MTQPAPATRARPLDARVTFALFALVLALHFAAATVGWKRVSGPASMITGCMPSAVRIFTYGG